MKLAESSIPVLYGWVTLSDIATDAEVTRQYVHRLASDGRFKTLHRVGQSKTFVVRMSEARTFVDSRKRVDTSEPEAIDSTYDDSLEPI